MSPAPSCFYITKKGGRCATMARIINVEITGQFVRKDSKNAGVMGEGNVTTIHITMDNSWSGYGKRIVWRDANGENPVSIVLMEPANNGLMFDTLIPSEPLALPGWCSFTLEGYKEKDGVHSVSMSVSDNLFVEESDSYYKPAEPTPSQTQQIFEALGRNEEKVKASATEAKSWAVGSTGSREGEDTDNAKYYAGEAEKSAKNAKENASSAYDSAVKSQTSANNAERSEQESLDILNGIREAINNIPPGSTPIVNDLLTGGISSALSAEQGRLLGELANLTNYQRALHNLGAAVQENELDNAYFVGGGTGWGSFPVNQRGQAEYSGVAPLFDRWKNSFGDGGAITLTQNGVTFTGANPYLTIRQVLKRALPIGETYSLSILLHDKSFYTQVITVPTKNEYSQPVLIGNSMLRLFGPDLFELIVFNGDTIPEVVLIKLEPGKTQTAAYQKADGTWARLPQNLDYQQELAKCQVYQIELNPYKFQNPTVGTVTRGPSNWYCAIALPATMRTIPTLKIDRGTPTVECPDGTFPVSQLTLLSATFGMAIFVLTFSGSTPSAASSGILYIAGTDSGADAPSILLDANL